MATTIPPICPTDTVLLADVGNTRIKLALLVNSSVDDPNAAEKNVGSTAQRLPSVSKRHDLKSCGFRPAHLENWLNTVAGGSAVVLVASVHEAAAVRLEAALAEVSATRHRSLRQRRIGYADLPLRIQLAEPHKVGIDRLAAAAAAHLLTASGCGAIIVDCGTATTVDMVSNEGEFLGGAILPGPTLWAQSLAEGTSRLPAVAALERALPPAMPGRSTQEAIAAGIGWGIRGAIAKLVEEARRSLGKDAVVILTGGWCGAVRDVLPNAIEIPDLVLNGIALAASRACAR